MPDRENNGRPDRDRSRVVEHRFHVEVRGWPHARDRDLVDAGNGVTLGSVGTIRGLRHPAQLLLCGSDLPAFALPVRMGRMQNAYVGGIVGQGIVVSLQTNVLTLLNRDLPNTAALKRLPGCRAALCHMPTVALLCRDMR